MWWGSPKVTPSVLIGSYLAGILSDGQFLAMINGDFSEDYLFWISYIDSTDGKEGTYMI